MEQNGVVDGSTRFVGLDVHRRYATVAAVDSKQQVVLTAQRIDFNDFDEWVRNGFERDDSLLGIVNGQSKCAEECRLSRTGPARYDDVGAGLHDRAQEPPSLIDAWVLARPVTSAYIFTSFEARGRGPARSLPTDRPMDASAVWQVVRAYAEAAGLVGVKPHDFRRFVGTQLAAGDIRKAPLGHKRIDTTARHYVLDELQPGLTDDRY